MRVGTRGVLISVQEAHVLFKVPVGTLHRWAHEEQWEAFGGPRSRHWRIDDVDSAYHARRGPADNETEPT